MVDLRTTWKPLARAQTCAACRRLNVAASSTLCRGVGLRAATIGARTAALQADRSSSLDKAEPLLPPSAGPAATVNRLQSAAKSVRVADWQRAEQLNVICQRRFAASAKRSRGQCLLTVRFARDSMDSTFRNNVGTRFCSAPPAFCKKN